MFLLVVAYQNHICNQTACSWDDIDLLKFKLLMAASETMNECIILASSNQSQ